MEATLIWIISNSEAAAGYVAELLGRIKEDKSYIVECFLPKDIPSGEGLDLLPDIVLLDWEGVEGKGVQIIRLFKENEFFELAPIVLLTSSDTLKEAFEAGASDFIDKPLSESKLKLRLGLTLSLSKSIVEINEQKLQIEKQTQELELQKEVSDRMLLNILPYEIAEQLKKKGHAKTKLYRRATVMFTDFKDFSKHANELSAQELVEELDFYFQNFDSIIDEHYIEKIKTIGDSYMCAGGLPLKNRSNPFDVLLAALKITKLMREKKQINKDENKTLWECRIGIHTGAVVAGVIGKKKFAYDIWGDAVNTASRMESNSEVNKINISGDTYEQIKDYFDCTYRGKIEIKNIGEVDMYFVDRLKEEFSEDREGVYPNGDFKKMLAKL